MLPLSPALLIALTACGSGSDAPPPPTGDGPTETAGTTDSVPGTTDTACDPDADADGDGLSECDEEALGTDPELADSDGDGHDDGAETDCGADPLDVDERCHDCGWHRDDPGDLVSTGSAVGDVIGDMDLVDQCGQDVSLWDFAGTYHVLFMTATW